MKIKKLEPVTFDAANIGTFIHYGLEKLVNRIKDEGYRYGDYDEARIRSFGEELARDYLQDQLRDLNRTNRFAALYRRMTNLFCLVAGNVVSELRESGFRPYATEFSLEKVVLPLARGGEVQLIGSVDRVDVCHAEGKDYLKVTDYKTGSKTFDFCGITNRDNVQLPIYLYGLCRSGEWSHPVPAAACYMEAKTPAFEAPVPPEKLEESIRKFYRRNGAFLDDKVALAALDCAAGSNHHKIRYTSSGTLYKDSKVYPEALMQEMTDYMETVLKETAEGILGGQVRAVPLMGSDHNACRYCDFSALCGYDPQSGKARIYSDDPEEWRKKQ
jgi:ATP-dependent helicase/nuclease subunit B